MSLVLGLPLTQVKYVERIEGGLPIFIFNFNEREMHGIFEAVNGAVSVDPGIRGSQGSTHRPTLPVCDRARKDFPVDSPPESMYKEAIIDNYYSYTRFYFELDHKQADELAVLFRRQTITPARQLQRREEIDHRSAPQTDDVHVGYKATLISDDVVREKYRVSENLGRWGIQSGRKIPKKVDEWDNYSTSLNSELFSFGFSYDLYDKNVSSSPKYVQEDAVTFRVEKVSGKDMIEAGTFSFHSAACETFLSNVDKNTSEYPEEDVSSSNGGVVAPAKSVPFDPRGSKKRMQQPDENCEPACSHHPRLAREGATLLSWYERADSQGTGPPVKSGSLRHSRGDPENQSVEGYLLIGSKHEGNVQQPGGIGLGCEGHKQAEPCTHHSIPDGCSQEVSISSFRKGVSTLETSGRLNAKKGFLDEKFKPAGSVTSQASSARALSRGGYGAMFSWASEVTRFLSWNGPASRNAEQRECRQFLGKLRRLKIMRDESQAQALVDQIEALRIKPAKEDIIFGERFTPMDEQISANSIAELDIPWIQDPSHTVDQQKEREELVAEVGEPESTTAPRSSELDRSSAPQRSHDDHLRRAEWLKEAKWRLEEYEHMQHTFFVLENTRRFP